MTLSFKKPIILTRISQDNEEFVKLFSNTYKLGDHRNFFKSFPLFEIIFENGMQYNKDIASNSLICTSRYGVQALSFILDSKKKDIFCVGQSTADLALNSGFKKVFYPDVGNVLKLVELICLKLDSSSSTLHYLRGKEVSYDLKSELTKFGYQVYESIVYRQQRLKQKRDIESFISKENAGGVVFFSANVAKIFCDGIKIVPEGFLFFCISNRVAQVVYEKQLLGNYKVRIASQPTKEEIINLIYNEKSVWPN